MEKQILKSKYFFTREELTRFVNENNIPQTRIQTIIVVEDKHLVLFYWDLEIKKVINE